ncbi:MAG: terminase small subunit [Desulfobulbia bacterium]
MEIKDEVVKPTKKLKKLYSKLVNKPPVYKSPQDMLTMVNQYVDYGCKTKLVKVGKAPNTYAIEVKILTLMGIVLHLGFTSRKQMYNYSANHSEYSETIAYAKTLITQYYEEKMQEGVSPTAMIFMLHNLDGLSMNNQQDTGDASKPIPKLEFTRSDNTNKIRKMNGG